MRLKAAGLFALATIVLVGGVEAQEAISDKRMELAKQLIAQSDFPRQVLRAIGPQLSGDITERYKKAGKSPDDKVVNGFMTEFTTLIKPKIETAVGEATPVVARVFSDDELSALLQMSSTPAGKSALEKFPSYFGAIMNMVAPMLQREVPVAIKQTADSLKQKGLELPQ